MPPIPAGAALHTDPVPALPERARESGDSSMNSYRVLWTAGHNNADTATAVNTVICRLNCEWWLRMSRRPPPSTRSEKHRSHLREEFPAEADTYGFARCGPGGAENWEAGEKPALPPQRLRSKGRGNLPLGRRNPGKAPCPARATPKSGNQPCDDVNHGRWCGRGTGCVCAPCRHALLPPQQHRRIAAGKRP